MTLPLDELTLKWGTLKGYHIHSEAACKALDEYLDLPSLQTGITDGVTTITGAAMQRDSQEQKLALCALVDALNNPEVYLDWDGKYVSKEKAKEYIMSYRG